MSADFDLLTELELKKRCREFGLPESGPRTDLIQRLVYLKKVASKIPQLKVIINELNSSPSLDNSDRQSSQTSVSSSTSTQVAESTPQKKRQASGEDSFDLDGSALNRTSGSTESKSGSKVMKVGEGGSVKREIYLLNLPVVGGEKVVSDQGWDEWTSRGRGMKMSCGKHMGKSFDEVFVFDRDYCKWVQRLDNPNGGLMDFREWLDER